jgi:hypothetical protein
MLSIISALCIIMLARHHRSIISRHISPFCLLKTFSRIRNRLNRPVLTISSSQASFTSLSNELRAQIFEFGHVSDHLSLAMTCRRLSQGGQPTLIRHQKDFQEYNVVSDFLPLTIPLVLQKVVRDQYVARDIRSIEIWGDRLTWDCRILPA